MKELVLILDWLDGPILADRDENGRYTTGIEVVDDDLICRQLDEEIYNLYDSKFIYDSDGVPRDVNLEKKEKNRNKILTLINDLKKRLAEINDGSFIVIDRVSEEYE